MRPRSVIASAVVLTALAALALVVLAGRGGRGEASAAAAITDSGSPPDRDNAGAVPGELIVRFEPDADADHRQKARGSVNAQLKRQLPVKGMQLLELPAGTRPSDAAARVERQPGVDYAEPNFSRHALGTVNDTYFPYEWGRHNTGQSINGRSGTPDADIDAPEAWDVVTGDPGTTVAVVDTGVDAARSVRLARSIRSLSSAGRTRITVRPAHRWARLIRRGTLLHLQLTIRDPAGNSRRVVKRVRAT